MPAATRQTIPPVSDSETDGATEQMTSRSVLDSLLESGLHEMNRERSGLLLSGGVGGARHRVRPTDDGGGVDALAGGFGDLTTELLLASVYSIGFMFVILGRSELFRTHATLAVIPVRPAGVVQTVGSALGTGVRREPRRRAALHPARDPVDAGARRRRPQSFETIALKLVDHDLPWLFVGGVFAGWLMGLLAWLVTAAQDTTARILLVLIVTGTIGLLHLPHSIAGNVECCCSGCSSRPRSR